MRFPSEGSHNNCHQIGLLRPSNPTASKGRCGTNHQWQQSTNDISQPLQYHKSKTSARRFFTNKKTKRWTEECFEEIDWEHLELALKNKPEGYKVWRSKQNLGFCGARVQVGRYAGEHQPNEKCPNCGQREIAEHLMLCPNQDRTRLLTEQTKILEEWLYKDEKTEPELAYWIPKYIRMRGTTEFGAMGTCLP